MDIYRSSDVFVRSAEHARDGVRIIAAARRPRRAAAEPPSEPGDRVPRDPPPPKTWMKGRLTSVVALSEAKKTMAIQNANTAVQYRSIHAKRSHATK